VARRGRHSIMRDKIPVVVNIEREDIEELRYRNINLSSLVRESVKKTLENSKTPREKLKIDIENALIGSRENHTASLKSLSDLNKLESEGKYDAETIEYLRRDVENNIFSSSSHIKKFENMLSSSIFQELPTKKRHPVYGRSKNVPFNTQIDGSVFHHMHLELVGGIHRNIGIYMPKTLHRSIKHSSISGEGMKEINKVALLWLCEQDTI